MPVRPYQVFLTLAAVLAATGVAITASADFAVGRPFVNAQVAALLVVIAAWCWPRKRPRRFEATGVGLGLMLSALAGVNLLRLAWKWHGGGPPGTVGASLALVSACGCFIAVVMLWRSPVRDRETPPTHPVTAYALAVVTAVLAFGGWLFVKSQIPPRPATGVAEAVTSGDRPAPVPAAPLVSAEEPTPSGAAPAASMTAPAPPTWTWPRPMLGSFPQSHDEAAVRPDARVVAGPVATADAEPAGRSEPARLRDWSAVRRAARQYLASGHAGPRFASAPDARVTGHPAWDAALDAGWSLPDYGASWPRWSRDWDAAPVAAEAVRGPQLALPGFGIDRSGRLLTERPAIAPTRRVTSRVFDRRLP